MKKHDERSAECLVFTEKEGLLSAIAHDLRLRVGRFAIEWDEAAATLAATFDATSLVVETAMRDGAPLPGALSDADKRKIEANIRADVLHTAAHPTITLAGVEVLADGADAHRVRARLSLHGRAREIGAVVRREGPRYVTEVTLHQPDFGITPYRAMMGTLRIKPHVRVRLAVPA